MEEINSHRQVFSEILFYAHQRFVNNLVLNMFNIDKPNGSVPWKFIAFMKKTGAPGECFLHAQSVLSKFNTGLIMRLLHLLYDIKVIIIMAKKKTTLFLCFIL